MEKTSYDPEGKKVESNGSRYNFYLKMLRKNSEKTPTAENSRLFHSIKLDQTIEQKLVNCLEDAYVYLVHSDFDLEDLADAGLRNRRREESFFNAVDQSITEHIPFIDVATRKILREELLKLFAQETGNGGLVNYSLNYQRKNDIGEVQKPVREYYQKLDKQYGRTEPKSNKAEINTLEKIALQNLIVQNNNRNGHSLDLTEKIKEKTAAILPYILNDETEENLERVIN